MRLQPALLTLIFSASALFSADAALLNLVMPEARMVAGIDVERSRDSFLGRKLLEQLDAKDTELAKFVALTGFDPRRDLREILIAAPNASSKDAPMLFIVRGVFDTGRLNGALRVAGIAPVESIGGVELFTKKEDKDHMSLAFVDGTLAIAGNIDMVRAALKRRSGSASALNAATYAKVQSISRTNDLWFVSSIPVAELSGALPSNNSVPPGMMGGEAFAGIEQSARGIRLGADVMELTAETVSKTEKDATGLADVARFLATLVQMNRSNPDVKALATALDSMKVSTDARTTRLSISLPTAELEKMLKATVKPAPAKKI